MVSYSQGLYFSHTNKIAILTDSLIILSYLNEISLFVKMSEKVVAPFYGKFTLKFDISLTKAAVMRPRP